MSFFYPQMLWMFAGLPLLAGLYLLRVRPVKEPVTAFFLWEEIFGDSRRTAMWGRLRNLLGLLLMLLAFSLAILAAAGLNFSEGRQRDMVLVLDTSASMRTAAGTGANRFGQAREECRRIISSLASYQRCALAAAAGSLAVPGGFTASRRALADTLESFEPGYGQLSACALSGMDFPGMDFSGGNPVVAGGGGGKGTVVTVDTAAGAAKMDNPAVQIVFVSDGAFAGEELPENVRLVKTGGSADNIGICGLDMLSSPAQDSTLVWCRLASSLKDKPVAAELYVYRAPCGVAGAGSGAKGDGADTGGMPGGALLKVVPVEIKPGLNSPVIFTVSGVSSGNWKIELQAKDISDSLSEDNTAWYSLPETEPASVSVTAGDTANFFRNAVNAFSGERMGLVTGGGVAEINICRGVAPWFKKGKNYILFSPPAGKYKGLGDFSDGDIRAVSRKLQQEHRAGRFLDFSGRVFGGIKPVTLPEGATVLFSISSDTGGSIPLIYKAYPDGATAWVCNFNPLYGHFILSPYFPVLIKALSEDLLHRDSRVRMVSRPGEPFPENCRLVASPYMPAADGGAELEGDKSGSVAGREFTMPGLYTFETAATGGKKGREFTVACSLLSATESMVNDFYLPPRKKNVVEVRRYSPAPWLLCAALLILVLEEILYHRRKVD